MILLSIVMCLFSTRIALLVLYILTPVIYPQIALPTFQSVHTPLSTTTITSGTITFTNCGSYNAGTSQENTAGANSGHGQVVITW